MTGIDDLIQRLKRIEYYADSWFMHDIEPIIRTLAGEQAVEGKAAPVMTTPQPVAGDVREKVAMEIEFWLVDGNDTYIPAKPDDDTYTLADRILALLRPEPSKAEDMYRSIVERTAMALGLNGPWNHAERWDSWHDIPERVAALRPEPELRERAAKYLRDNHGQAYDCLPDLECHNQSLLDADRLLAALATPKPPEGEGEMKGWCWTAYPGKPYESRHWSEERPDFDNEDWRKAISGGEMTKPVPVYTRPAEKEAKLVRHDHDLTLRSKHDPNRDGLD